LEVFAQMSEIAMVATTSLRGGMELTQRHWKSGRFLQGHAI